MVKKKKRVLKLETSSYQKQLTYTSIDRVYAGMLKSNVIPFKTFLRPRGHPDRVDMPTGGSNMGPSILPMDTSTG